MCQASDSSLPSRESLCSETVAACKSKGLQLRLGASLSLVYLEPIEFLAAGAAIKFPGSSGNLAANFVDRRGDAHRRRLGATGLKPSSREPFLGDQELREAAVQTDLDIGLRRHGRVTHGARGVAIEPNLSGDDGQRPGFALGTDHLTLQK